MTAKRNAMADRLVAGYKSVLTHSKEFLDQATEGAKPKLKYAMEYAVEKASELGELTREEAEKVSDYLLNDAKQAATMISEGERELADLARLDLLYIEDKLWDAFSNMVDHTQLELEHLREDAIRFGEWHTGEVTSMGTLKCRECGQLMHFKATAHIPPCPHCHGTHFVRNTDE